MWGLGAVPSPPSVDSAAGDLHSPNLDTCIDPLQAKHTAGEEAAKNKLATGNIGGGKAGIADRTGGAAGHAKYGPA